MFEHIDYIVRDWVGREVVVHVEGVKIRGILVSRKPSSMSSAAHSPEVLVLKGEDDRLTILKGWDKVELV